MEVTGTLEVDRRPHDRRRAAAGRGSGRLVRCDRHPTSQDGVPAAALRTLTLDGEYLAVDVHAVSRCGWPYIP